MTAAVSSGVYPCYENQFKVGIPGSGDTVTDTVIKECETFEISFDNGVEEWSPFEERGWVKRLMTAKSLTITVTAKRRIGDPGNDFIAGKTFVDPGQQAQAKFTWTLPDGSSLVMNDAIISVTNNNGGDATNVAPLEFEVMSNGKPTYTPAA